MLTYNQIYRYYVARNKVFGMSEGKAKEVAKRQLREHCDLARRVEQYLRKTV